MAGPGIQIVGPSFTKIFKILAKQNVNMIKPIMQEATVMVQKEAKFIAPYKTGRYRQSIRRSVRTFKRAGSVVGLVGVHDGELDVWASWSIIADF